MDFFDSPNALKFMQTICELKDVRDLDKFVVYVKSEGLELIKMSPDTFIQIAIENNPSLRMVFKEHDSKRLSSCTEDDQHSARKTKKDKPVNIPQQNINEEEDKEEKLPL